MTFRPSCFRLLKKCGPETIWIQRLELEETWSWRQPVTGAVMSAGSAAYAGIDRDTSAIN